jgi:tRNA modification GTPase
MSALPQLQETICALATPQGSGALGVVRLSGPRALAIGDVVFRGKQRLVDQLSHTIQYGMAMQGNQPVDEVMAAVFRAPRSFTTEDTVEFSCHGSPFVLSEVLRLLCEAGARPAEPGEFTLRAFMHGRIDLAQAEAVADLIAADSAAARDIALRQLRGGISHRLSALRAKLVDFAALLELELDFSEEDVEFAGRNQLRELLGALQQTVEPLLQSFKLGNALRHGVATVIAGRPNAGKSTLLNAWLQEERAIVSDIPGTTRDTIEEVLHLEGIAFRLIDTAGIREATDAIERIGVERTLEKIRQSALLVYLFDPGSLSPDELDADISRLRRDDLPVFLAGNKTDLDQDGSLRARFAGRPIFWLSALSGEGLQQLEAALVSAVTEQRVQPGQPVLSNLRHYDALRRASTSLRDVLQALDSGQSAELVALDLRRTLDALGEVTGAVTNDEVLGNIFSKFCIGK